MKGYVRTDYSMIYYEYIKCPNPNAETILFVHGMGLDMTTWDGVVDGFKMNYHILRYDLPGNGRSELFNRRDDFGWDLLIGDLELLLKHLHINSLHFVGHSGAGNFGVELAIRDKRFLKSLILISTPLFVPGGLTEKEMKERNNWKDEKTFNEKMAFLAKNICYPEEENKIDRIVNIYKQTSIDTYLAYFNLYSQAIHNYKLDELSDLTIPTLMLVGEFDTLYPPQLLMMNLTYLTNARLLIIPNASNAIMIDNPTRFVEDTANFLNSLTEEQSVTTYNYTETMLDKIKSIVQMSFKLKDTRVQLNIIKKFELILDGVPVEGKWKQRKAMQIITYIIYYQSVTREQLYDAFWAHYDLTKARNYLSVSLNHIKSIIETSTGKSIDEYFDIDRDMISLKLNAQIDIKELQQRLNLLNNENDHHQKLATSLSLFQSLPENICAGFYDNWIIGIKVNLEHQILNICESLFETKIRNEHKIDILKIMVKYNPLEEAYYEKLIYILEEIGSRETGYFIRKLNRLLALEK